MSRDPIGYAGGANLFEHCLGDPVDTIDPFGLRCAGNFFDYIFSRDYLSDVGGVFTGY